jgi:hypothetical protein
VDNQLHDNAVESNLPLSATPPPSPPLLLFQDPQDLPPQDPLPPQAVRRLAFETVEMQQATDSQPQRSPSRERAANRVGEEAPFPTSSIVYCFQYMMKVYKQQNGPLPGNEKVGEWLRNVETAYSSNGPAAPSHLNSNYFYPH